MHASFSRGADDKLGAGVIPFRGGGTWTEGVKSFNQNRMGWREHFFYQQSKTHCSIFLFQAWWIPIHGPPVPRGSSRLGPPDVVNCRILQPCANVFDRIFSELGCHEAGLFTLFAAGFQQDVHANPDLNRGQDHIPAQNTAAQETAPPLVGETSSRRHQTSTQARWNMRCKRCSVSFAARYMVFPWKRLISEFCGCLSSCTFIRRKKMRFVAVPRYNILSKVRSHATAIGFMKIVQAGLGMIWFKNDGIRKFWKHEQGPNCTLRTGTFLCSHLTLKWFSLL